VTTRLRAQIAEGLRFVAGDRFVRETVGLIGGINLAFNAMTLVLIVRARDLGAGPAAIGVMLGMYGAGGLVGALLSARLHATIPGRVLMIGITWLWAGLCAAYVLAPSALWIGALAAGISFLGPPYNVVVTAATYRITPEGMLGRVRSTAKLVAWGTIPLAGLLGGLLAEHLGAGPGLLGLSALLLLMALLTTASPGLRTFPADRPAS
jgi:MFS family permease